MDGILGLDADRTIGFARIRIPILNSMVTIFMLSGPCNKRVTGYHTCDGLFNVYERVTGFQACNGLFGVYGCVTGCQKLSPTNKRVTGCTSCNGLCNVYEHVILGLGVDRTMYLGVDRTMGFAKIRM